jgi:hypothetical protein
MLPLSLTRLVPRMTRTLLSLMAKLKLNRLLLTLNNKCSCCGADAAAGAEGENCMSLMLEADADNAQTLDATENEGDDEAVSLHTAADEAADESECC